MTTILAQHLGRNFGTFQAVKDVSFSVEEGEIFGYLGANGAGKTSTIRILCGLLAPTQGSAQVAGYDVALNPEAVKANLGYMSQKFSLYLDLPVEENLRFFGGTYGLSGKTLVSRMHEVLSDCELLGMEPLRTGDLPGGIRQRVALASALLHHPKVLFLDEPTACVDPQARRHFWKLIRGLAKDGTTIFVTTHYLDEAEFCHRIGLMAEGRLIALDTPQALKSRYMPHRLFRLSGNDLRKTSGLLTKIPGILSVEPFGAGLHIQVTDPQLDATLLLARLTSLGEYDLHIEEIPASLEDVFLAALKANTEAPS
jgi:ABC-2 type transport system ATP-binding protein